jgi:hypothetical protein
LHPKTEIVLEHLPAGLCSIKVSGFNF